MLDASARALVARLLAIFVGHREALWIITAVAIDALSNGPDRAPARAVVPSDPGRSHEPFAGQPSYWDHQLMQEMYTITFKPAAEVKDKWDLSMLSAPVPVANQSLEVLAPTREENNCTMPA